LALGYFATRWRPSQSRRARERGVGAALTYVGDGKIDANATNEN
jgi:hypothetical protein